MGTGGKRFGAPGGFHKKVAEIKRARLASEQVVSISEFRALKKTAEPKVILVVDDEEAMRASLKRLLESEGYFVVTAEDGLELAKILETKKLDLILLDIQLPWVDGIELCTLLKEDHEVGKVPIVIMSARHDGDTVKRATQAGCEEFIAKPVSADLIISVVSRTVPQAS